MEHLDRSIIFMSCNWEDNAFLLNTSRLGENGLILSLFTLKFGKKRAFLKITQKTSVTLYNYYCSLFYCVNEYTKNPNGIGFLSTCSLEHSTARIYDEPNSRIHSFAITSAAHICNIFLQQNERNEDVYYALKILIKDNYNWHANYIKFEESILNAAGVSNIQKRDENSSFDSKLGVHEKALKTASLMLGIQLQFPKIRELLYQNQKDKLLSSPK